MKSRRSINSTFGFRSVIGIVVLIALLATLTPLFARQDQDDSLVYRADSLPFGMTYGDWNAAPGFNMGCPFLQALTRPSTRQG